MVLRTATRLAAPVFLSLGVYVIGMFMIFPFFSVMENGTGPLEWRESTLRAFWVVIALYPLVTGRNLHHPWAPLRSACGGHGCGHGHGDRHGVACVLDARAFAAVTRNDTIVTQEMEIRTILKEELSRLMENAVAPEDIADGISLFDVGEEGSESLGLDSLDALELAMSFEQHYGVTVPTDVNGLLAQFYHNCM